MTTTRQTTWWAIALVATIAACLLSPSALAQSQTTVTGAGSGVFPSGASFNGVSLSAVTFGMGVVDLANGTSTGAFESTLTGTSVTGIARNIVVVGTPTRGSGNNYAGLCSIDPGDGTQFLSGVPFTVTVATLSNGERGLTITLGTTQLPAAAVNTGSVTIK
jgi:hypothetical protein